MLSPKKLLENARNRIAKRENWARGIARTADGFQCHPTSPDACSWCLIGSIAAEAGVAEYYTYSVDHPNYKDAIHAVAQAIQPDASHPDEHNGSLSRSPYSIIYTFNDLEARHEGVLKVMDRAIANMRSE